MTVRIEPGRRFENSVSVLVVGAGACGLIAALAARDAGADVLVLEQNRTPTGSTGLSSGFIPASYTRWQEQAGAIDSPGTMMADLQAKCAGANEQQMVRAITAESKRALHWLADTHALPFELVDRFLYPGHSAAPERTGQGLMARLIRATQAAGVDLLCDARGTALFADDSRRVLGVELTRPDGFAWSIYDERLHRLGMEFEDYRNAHSAGEVRTAPDVTGLAAVTGLDADALSATLRVIERCAQGERNDEYGRDFRGKPVLGRPLHAIKVTGALFHTQGGLRVDDSARVCDSSARSLPSLFAGGGAEAGISGDHVRGYLSGNGLLSAVSLGALAGRSATQTVGKAAP